MPQAARQSSLLTYVFAFPMLIVPFAIYNMIAYLMDMDFHQTVFSVPLISGHVMDVSTGDVLVLLGVILLYVEISQVHSLLDHGDRGSRPVDHPVHRHDSGIHRGGEGGDLDVFDPDGPELCRRGRWLHHHDQDRPARRHVRGGRPNGQLIDDFGASHTSLRNLRKLGVDTALRNFN